MEELMKAIKEYWNQHAREYDNLPGHDYIQERKRGRG